MKGDGLASEILKEDKIWKVTGGEFRTAQPIRLIYEKRKTEAEQEAPDSLSEAPFRNEICKEGRSDRSIPQNQLASYAFFGAGFLAVFFLAAFLGGDFLAAFFFGAAFFLATVFFFAVFFFAAFFLAAFSSLAAS